MEYYIRLVGPQRAVEILGIRLVGINAENGKKLLFSLVFILIIFLIGRLLNFIVSRIPRTWENYRFAFWLKQAVRLTLAIVLLVGLASIWFNDPYRLATALGLVTAGLAFALQKVVTAVAGYFIILRGKVFNVGDRIVMGGVRGDVIALRFTQTVIMEMGQPPAVQQAAPAMWVQARQYTGRVVTVSNARIFDDPVYNYTMDFLYIWEEMSIPISYKTDHARAEKILMDAAARHTITMSKLGAESLREMQRRYLIKPEEVGPKIYYRLTDNWLELTVRFIAEEWGIRAVKDAMSRDILREFDSEGITVASQTIDIVGFPPLAKEGKYPNARDSADD
jgi:small-conductance mechanosensitive channel